MNVVTNPWSLIFLCVEMDCPIFSILILFRAMYSSTDLMSFPSLPIRCKVHMNLWLMFFLDPKVLRSMWQIKNAQGLSGMNF